MFLVVIISYVIGSIPTAYIMGRLLKGIDIRDHGSRNVGATNVFRVVGRGPGILTLALDILKGFIVVFLLGYFTSGPNPELVKIVGGFFVIAGHNWTVFLRFKGGKGVATSVGVFLALAPVPTAIAFLVFALVFVPSKKVSPGSIIGALVFPFLVYSFKETVETLLFASIVSFVIIVNHIPNIKRLVKGTEQKIIN
ncbi:MAG: glycerol-3-phosphate 1-O-acyltransferase PlsY [bacterium]